MIRETSNSLINLAHRTDPLLPPSPRPFAFVPSLRSSLPPLQDLSDEIFTNHKVYTRLDADANSSHKMLRPDGSNTNRYNVGVGGAWCRLYRLRCSRYYGIKLYTDGRPSD
jgi:hypothetical protein